jgi:hypothetical protein
MTQPGEFFLALEGVLSVLIFPPFSVLTVHRKYSIYRHELNHAQQAGAGAPCSGLSNRSSLEQVVNSTQISISQYLYQPLIANASQKKTNWAGLEKKQFFANYLSPQISS